MPRFHPRRMVRVTPREGSEHDRAGRLPGRRALETDLVERAGGNLFRCSLLMKEDAGARLQATAPRRGDAPRRPARRSRALSLLPVQTRGLTRATRLAVPPAPTPDAPALEEAAARGAASDAPAPPGM